MHEMSIAQNILDILRDEMTKRKIARLKRVTIKNGQLAGVVTEALVFAWDALTPSISEFDGSELVVEEVPLKVACGKCGTQFVPEHSRYMPCPECEEVLGHEVLEGKELYIDSIEPADSE
ncbi:hydrogenase maturation nickel metallochaperone HypA/HybF [Salidesulfovibrio brasiliensis]|uniref:hydrogenase maturation nickel metallochaperone HypA/HybF n=1 Tax=Salidesulfovibrio brasiliensis TaxID=221711 RepID=UPI0006D18093|nr:hydrogenase maturation nickel metallochaperone HypA [Salidesulfovibrio brasiliensis]